MLCPNFNRLKVDLGFYREGQRETEREKKKKKKKKRERYVGNRERYVGNTEGKRERGRNGLRVREE